MSKLKLTLILTIVALTASCGSSSGSAAVAGVSGVFVDPSVGETLKVRFKEVQDCTGVSTGSFEDLNINIRPPGFTCMVKGVLEKCSGLFIFPNIINVSWHMRAWKHEVIHYLLLLSTGNPDQGHISAFFSDCIF